MTDEPSTLVVQTDYNAVTKMIRLGIIAAGVCIIIVTSLLTPIYILYANDVPLADQRTMAPNVFSAAFYMILIILININVRSALQKRKDLPVLYTFTDTGFTSHISGQTYVWDDFSKFQHFLGRLFFPLKQSNGTSVVISRTNMSQTSYNNMVAHVKRHAPAELTGAIKTP